MISRIWRGWTTPENAAAYERLLKTQIIPGIEAMKISGYLGIELLRRELNDEVEFVTIMSFESLKDITNFTGEDYERAYVPTDARAILKRYDERSLHYEVRQRIEY